MFSITATLLASLIYISSIGHFSSAGSTQQQCTSQLETCQGLALGVRPGGTTGVIGSDSINSDCSILVQATQCLKTAASSTACRGFFTQNHLAQLQKAYNVVEYICVTKLSDVIGYQGCYQDVSVKPQIEACVRKQGRLTCDTSRLLTCTDKVLNSSSNCSSGAKQLFRDIIQRAVAVAPGCKMFKSFKRFYADFF